MAALMAVHAPITRFTGLQHTPWRARTMAPFRSSHSRSPAPRTVARGGASLEKMADKLGDEMYADLNGWHLYLRDMKSDGGKTMAQVLAEAVASGDSLDAALKGTDVKLGGGKKTVALSDVVPDNQIKNATRALEDLD